MQTFNAHEICPLRPTCGDINLKLLDIPSFAGDIILKPASCPHTTYWRPSLTLPLSRCIALSTHPSAIMGDRFRSLYFLWGDAAADRIIAVILRFSCPHRQSSIMTASNLVRTMALSHGKACQTRIYRLNLWVIRRLRKLQTRFVEASSIKQLISRWC